MFLGAALPSPLQARIRKYEHALPPGKAPRLVELKSGAGAPSGSTYSIGWAFCMPMIPQALLIDSPSPSHPSEASKRLLPWLVAVAFFMESLDTTILNTAVPAISSALRVTPLSMKAVLASYTLSLAVCIPISGWMADRFGTRRVFAAAIGLFTLGSFLCGISGNIHLLVAFRVLQGCGGAMMVPVGRLTLVRTFAKSDLLRTMSFVSIPALVAPMLGPIAGGLIVGY